MSNAIIWGIIDTQPVLLPLDVSEFNSAMMLFPVPAASARALIPGEAFEVVETEPGLGELIVAANDFRQNPWGDYDEIDIGVVVRPAGAPEDAHGGLVHRTLVNQRFGFEAGHRALAFPRTVNEIDVSYTDETVTFDLTVDGDPTLRLELPRAPAAGPPERMGTPAYSLIDGVAYQTPVEISMPTGIVDPDDVVVELGTGPLADELRGLGLPCAPTYSSWGEGMSATFHRPQPLPSAPPG